MSGNALRRSAQPSRSRVASSLAAHFSQMPVSIICFGTPALLTDTRTNIHAGGRLPSRRNSCGHVSWGSAWVATPLPPILHGFVQVPERRVVLNSPLPQHLGTDYFGVVIPLSPRLPTVLAVFCCRLGIGCCCFALRRCLAHQFILVAVACMVKVGTRGQRPAKKKKPPERTAKDALPPPLTYAT